VLFRSTLASLTMSAVAQLRHNLTTTPITSILERKSKESSELVTLNDDDNLDKAIQVLSSLEYRQLL